MNNPFVIFYKPRNKREIFKFLRQKHVPIGRLRHADFKQLYAVYCSYFKK